MQTERVIYILKNRGEIVFEHYRTVLAVFNR